MAKLTLIEGRTISTPDRRFWDGTASIPPTYIDYTYSIGLFDLVTWSALGVPEADPAEGWRGTPWFQFPTPPQLYEVSENAATVITPTQNGGKFVESQGSIFKDIRLSGTVGLRPNVPDSNLLPSGLSKATGLTLSVPKTVSLFTNDNRGLSPKEITGFDDITFLRNLFRAYWDFKKSNEWARRVVMVWIYKKDSDIYIVEPMQFVTNKEKSNPLSYTYNINLRTLYRFDTILFLEKDPLSIWQNISNAFKVASQAIRDIVTALNQIASVVDYVRSIPARILDMFAGVAIQVLEALVNLKNTGARFDSEGRRLVKKLGDDGREIAHLCTVLEHGIDTTGSKMSTFSNPSPTFAGTVTLSPAASLAILRNQLVRAVSTIARASDRILSVDSFFSSPKQIIVEDQKPIYNKGGVPFNAGSPLNINNIVIPTAAQEDVVGGNETIRDIAKRTLGDESYWKMLVILNNLKPPYISVNPSDKTLSPGSKILIPKKNDPGDFSNVTTNQNTDAGFEELSPMAKQYGRDLCLSGSSSTGNDFADLKVSQRGDLATVDGVTNIKQAMVIKASTEQGQLSLHPTFGAAYPVGSKVSLGQIQEFILNTRRTFLSDPRVKSVYELKALADGDLIRVYAKISLRQSDMQLPIEFSVRRG